MSVDPGPTLSPPSAHSSGRTVLRVGIIAVLALVVTAGVGHTLLDLLSEGEREGQGAVALNPLLLCLSGVLWSAGIAVQGPRWAVLLPTAGKPPGLVRSALAVLGTNALTVTLPGPSGEALLAAFCERDFGIPWATGAAAKFLSRLLGLAILGGMLLAGVAVVPGAAGWAPAWMAGVAALAAGSLLLCVYWFSSHGVRAGVVSLLAWLPAAKRARVEVPVLAIVDQALAPGGQPPVVWVRAAGWSLVSVALTAAGGYASAAAVGVEPGPLVYLWMHVVSSVGGLVGMLIPAGIGPLDALWVALFVLVRPPGSDYATAVRNGLLATIAWRQMQAISLLISLGPLAWVGRRTGA